MNPLDSEFDSVSKLIEQAKYNTENTKLLISNAENTASSNKILPESVNNYCDEVWDGLGPNINMPVLVNKISSFKAITDNISKEALSVVMQIQLK